jgi:AAA domain/Bifunctional DNA primase/polymerase, N-terminal
MNSNTANPFDVALAGFHAFPGDIGKGMQRALGGLGAFCKITGDEADKIVNEALLEFQKQSTAAPAAPVVLAPVAPTPTFKDIALRSVARGEKRVLPIAIGGKNPLITWADKDINSMTTEQWETRVSSWIEEINAEYPEANVCVIAKPEERIFIDCDTYKELIYGYEEYMGGTFPVTYTTSARDNRTQIHFLQTDASRKLGNVPQFKATSTDVMGDIAGVAGGPLVIDLSVRQRNQYVLAEGSRHPKGTEYTRISDTDKVVPIPDDLIEYILHLKSLADKIKASKADVTDPGDGELIPHGEIHPFLLHHAGKLRHQGFGQEIIEAALLDLAHRKCQPPIDEDKIRNMAQAVSKYEKGPTELRLTQKPEPSSLVTAAPVDISKWREQFRSLGQMDQRPIEIIINGVLQEGTCFIGASPAAGKTLVALSMAKSICTGTPLFGLPQYAVTKPRTVLYLIPESRDAAFRQRCTSFGMPDSDLFLTRTISAGPPMPLDSPLLKEAIKNTNPVIFLDTAIRFMQSGDENAAAQNKTLVNDVLSLQAAGAIAVVLIHHATKQSENEAMTLENMLRGTSDFGAMCDMAYGIRKDKVLYNYGSGPMEIEFVNLKDRERVGDLSTIRLAASYKQPGDTFIKSYIDETHNFKVVDAALEAKSTLNKLLEIIRQDLNIPVDEIMKLTNMTGYQVTHTLAKAGWHRVKGGPGGASPWHQDNGKACPFAKDKAADITKAVDWLKKLFEDNSEDGTLRQAYILKQADKVGISDTLVNKAEKRLGIKKDKDSDERYMPEWVSKAGNNVSLESEDESEPIVVN